MSFLNNEFTLCITNEILNEYEEIFQRFMGSRTANLTIQIILAAPNVLLVNNYFNWNLITKDPDDNKFVDCAIAANARYLVSNDKHFNVLKSIPFPKIELLNLEEFEQLIKP